MRIYKVIPDDKDSRHGRVFGPLFEARCALGAGGVLPTDEKAEGDGATPAGTFPFRHVYYRPDQHEEPITVLPVSPIRPDMGWCDDPLSRFYNRPVGLPFAGSHEKMWRGDDIYNLVIALGYNDAPVIAGKGSAIFMHLARDGNPPTRGCIALSEEALTRFLRQVMPDDKLVIDLPSA